MYNKYVIDVKENFLWPCTKVDELNILLSFVLFYVIKQIKRAQKRKENASLGSQIEISRTLSKT